MQRYFGKIEDGYATLEQDDVFHLVKSLRIRVGEKVEVVDGKCHLCEVNSLSPFRLKVIETISDDREPANEIIIAFCLIKGDRNEVLIEKGSEIGIRRFIPVLSERVIVKAEPGREDNRLQRLRKIAKSAACQSRRGLIPEVSAYLPFDDLLKVEADHRLLAYEAEAGKGKSIGEALDNLEAGESILLLIGPEGGFSPEEAEKAISVGFSPISLGKSILRAETAGIVGAALMVEASAKAEDR
ncbi:MAG: RsmE family RNA methyltransferase [Bacillota bacterium]|nr:RsmE family RNA methyltransferase [Bacillota bacterium]